MALVTVIMSVHNAMPYLPDAVASILSQTFGDYQFFIIDDASTDESCRYLKSLNDPRMEIITLASNKGPGHARNAGIERCRTELLAIMDADDIAYPNRLAVQAAYLQKHPHVGMVGCQVTYLGSTGRTGFSPPLDCDHGTIYANLLQGNHAINNSSIMCRTHLLKQIGGYRVPGTGEDWDMFLRMCEITQVANVKQILQSYRLHENSENAVKAAFMRDCHAHACHCARRRLRGEQEIGFNSFSEMRHKRPYLSKALGRIDIYAYIQYRRALSEILGTRPVLGWGRMIWSCLCSPQRLARYMLRLLSRLKSRLMFTSNA